MPSPAINTFDVVGGSFSQFYMRKGYDYQPPKVTTKSFTSHFQALRCPAVVVTEPRSDGTRPPAPWSKDWARGSQASYPFVEQPLPAAPLGESYAVRPSRSVIAPSWPSTKEGAWLEHSIRLSRLKQREWYIDQVAKTRVLNKLARGKVQLGVTLGEMKQTVGLVTDLATGVVDGIKSIINMRHASAEVTNRFFRTVIREGDTAKALAKAGLHETEALNKLRNGWMQYQFGIKPLVYDVHNSFDALYEHLYGEKGSLLMKVKSGFYNQEEKEYDNYGGVSPRGPRTAVTFLEEIGINYSLTYEMPPGGVPSDVLLGLDNGYATAWELMKLSWMVDYAVGMGDWLRSMTAARGLLFREGSRSMLLRSTSTSHRIVGPYSPKNKVGLDASDRFLFVEECGRFQRGVVPPTGVVPGVVPQLKTKLGLRQLGNSLFALSSWLQGGSLPR